VWLATTDTLQCRISRAMNITVQVSDVDPYFPTNSGSGIRFWNGVSANPSPADYGFVERCKLKRYISLETTVPGEHLKCS